MGSELQARALAISHSHHGWGWKGKQSGKPTCKDHDAVITMTSLSLMSKSIIMCLSIDFILNNN